MKNSTVNRFGVSLLALAIAGMLAVGCTSTPPSEPAEPGDELRALSRSEYGESRKVPADWEARVRAATPEEYLRIEQEMIWLLESEGATFASKQFACRILRQVGGEASLPVLAGLLDDEELSHPARLALQGNGSAGAGALLRDALGELEGERRRGVIDTIAYRGDRKAVPGLATALLDPDRDTVRSALEALGRIGGEAAAEALAAPIMDDWLWPVQVDARLACADSLLAEGERELALELYRELAGTGHPTACRVAAWRGIVGADPGSAVVELAGLFEQDEPELQRAAARFLLELPEGTTLTPLVSRVGGFGAEARILALGVLAERGAVAAVPSALAALESDDEGVRLAGLAALGCFGGAESVPRIVVFLGTEGPEAAVARRALEASGAEGLNEAITAQLEVSSKDVVRAELIGCLVARRADGVVPALLLLAESGEERTRRASIAGLEALGGETDLPDALALLAKLERPRDRRAMEKALLEICRRAGSEEAADVLVVASAQGEAPVRVTILHVLGAMPSEQTLAPLLSAAADGEVEVRSAAVEALAGWPDAAPGEVLQTLSLQEEEQSVRLAALEGYLRLSAAAPDGKSEVVQSAYRDAYAAARSTEEKKVVIECAGRSEELWAVGFLGSFREDADVGALAGSTHEALCSILARKVGHAAVGCAVTLEIAPVEKYAAGGPGTLTDGVWGSTEHGDGKWIGYNGEDLIATLDLGEVIDVHDVRVGFLRGQRSWIFPPASVELSLSDDGSEFRVLGTFEVVGAKRDGKTETSDVFARYEGVRGRYLRVHLVHPGILPKWHPGSGEPSWMFADEIAVNARYEP